MSAQARNAPVFWISVVALLPLTGLALLGVVKFMAGGLVESITVSGGWLLTGVALWLLDLALLGWSVRRPGQQILLLIPIGAGVLLLVGANLSQPA